MSVQLSLIIPVYKVEDYIQECLDSVFRQIPEGVEIIVVDDGSPDHSMEIIQREFSAWISSGTLILLDQTNKGPGGARNLGLKHAKGKYIGFLDSDDVLLPGYFDELMDRIDLGVADIIEFGFKRFTDYANIDSEPYKKLHDFNALVKLSRQRELIFATTRWFPSLRIYRRGVLDGFMFKEYIHYEDLASLPDIFLRDWFIHYIDRPLLGYRKRKDSITANHTYAQMLVLYGFYTSIPMDAESSSGILKISVARTLAHFYYELKPADFPINDIVMDIKVMRLSRKAQKTMLWPDWFLYKVPTSYMWINKLRIKRTNIISQE